MNIWQIVSIAVRSLLTMSLIGGVLVVALQLLKPVIKGRISKTAQYYLWVVVLLTFLVPFASFVPAPKAAATVVVQPMQTVQNALSETVKPTAQWQEEIAQEQYSVPFQSLQPDQQVQVTKQASGNWGNWNEWLQLLPFVVAAVSLLITLVQYWAFAAKLRNRRILPRRAESDLLKRLCKGKRVPLVYHSRFVPTPMLVGLFRPIVYLPDEDYTETQLKNILLHELTHLRRGDIYIKWLATFAVHLHWFNPLVYLARKQLNRTCELACDEAVIKRLSSQNKQDYGNTLIAVAAQHAVPNAVLATTMCEEKKELKERLRSIMKHKKMSRLAVTFTCLIFVSIIGAGALLAGCSKASASTPQSVSDSSVPDVEASQVLQEEQRKELSEYAQTVAKHFRYPVESAQELYAHESLYEFVINQLYRLDEENNCLPENISNVEWQPQYEMPNKDMKAVAKLLLGIDELPDNLYTDSAFSYNADNDTFLFSPFSPPMFVTEVQRVTQNSDGTISVEVAISRMEESTSETYVYVFSPIDNEQWGEVYQLVRISADRTQIENTSNGAVKNSDFYWQSEPFPASIEDPDVPKDQWPEVISLADVQVPDGMNKEDFIRTILHLAAYTDAPAASVAEISSSEFSYGMTQLYHFLLTQNLSVEEREAMHVKLEEYETSRYILLPADEFLTFSSQRFGIDSLDVWKSMPTPEFEIENSDADPYIIYDETQIYLRYYTEYAPNKIHSLSIQLKENTLLVTVEKAVEYGGDTFTYVFNVSKGLNEFMLVSISN